MATEPKSSSTTERIDPDTVPENWRWVLDVINEAHLPHLGLPIKWDVTQTEHAKIAYDPTSHKSFNIISEEESATKSSPVGFILSTAGSSVMPGTKRPAAVRFTRYQEPTLQENLINDINGEPLVPCLAHGDFVKVEALQADHVQAKKQIIQRQKDLVKKLNDDLSFADFIMQLDGMNKFFVKVQMTSDTEPKYYGTLFFYELYFNDIDNLWLICQACNLHKGAQETLDWLQKQWLFGKEFLEYLGKPKNKGILDKAKDGKGLATVAIEWFWDRHAIYISLSKSLLKNISHPFKVLNIEVDQFIGAGKIAEAERLEATIRGKIELASKIATMSGIDLPALHEKNIAGEPPKFVHDESGTALHPPQPIYEQAMQLTAAALPARVEALFGETVNKLMSDETIENPAMSSTKREAAQEEAEDAEKEKDSDLKRADKIQRISSPKK